MFTHRASEETPLGWWETAKTQRCCLNPWSDELSKKASAINLAAVPALQWGVLFPGSLVTIRMHIACTENIQKLTSWESKLIFPIYFLGKSQMVQGMHILGI